VPPRCFTHVDPFEDTESGLHRHARLEPPSFTHVDPFEDTESLSDSCFVVVYYGGFTHVDPFEDTESLFEYYLIRGKHISFTHVDPFEDTESNYWESGKIRRLMEFHPRRSVRGY